MLFRSDQARRKIRYLIVNPDQAGRRLRVRLRLISNLQQRPPVLGGVQDPDDGDAVGVRQIEDQHGVEAGDAPFADAGQRWIPCWQRGADQWVHGEVVEAGLGLSQEPIGQGFGCLFGERRAGDRRFPSGGAGFRFFDLSKGFLTDGLPVLRGKRGFLTFQAS